MTRVAIIAGATGLVGDAVVHQLLEDPEFSGVYAVGRRSLGLSHPKLREFIVSFTDLARTAVPRDVDLTDAFCMLGTTRGKAGSAQAFRDVDFTYVVNFAQWVKTLGVKQFSVISAMGSNPRSRGLYMRTKGEMEEAIKGIGFHSTIILRPSMLTGPRKERRVGEWIVGHIFTPLIGWILPKKYQSVSSDTVARAMVESLKTAPQGLTILTSDQLHAFKKSKTGGT